MSTVPRRPRPQPGDRAQTILTQTRGAHSGQGSSAAARPVVAPRLNRQHNPSLTGTASKDRLTMSWSTSDIVSDQGAIVWGGYSSSFDQEGASIQLSDPVSDDGRLYLFGEGLYCVTVQLTARTSESASSDQAVGASVQCWDRPDTESFACVVRGGDPHLHDTGSRAVSTTFYSQGRGLAGGGVQFFVQCNGATVSADVGQVIVLGIVQKIAGF